MAQYHDWLSLVNLSGLLVSEPVLNETFPEGPRPVENWRTRRFRAEYERWLVAKGQKDESVRRSDFRRWVGFVLRAALGHDEDRLRAGMSLPPDVRIELTDTMQRLSPDRVLMGADGEKALLIYFADGDLDRPEQVTGRWKASPFTKLDRLLRETRVPLGLLTNGDDWRLVYAEGNLPAAYIEWTAQGWYDERLTLDAFVMLLGVDRFDPAQPKTGLLALIRASQDRQMDVADQLGHQVRAGLWILVHALDEADRAAQGDLLRGMSLDDIYEMAIKVMMRLLFLLYAEEHRLLPHGEVLYDQGYGLTYLWTRLQRQQRENPDALEVTHDAWPQLLATFRMIYSGVQHRNFNLLAYGGDLFDPRRYPVLEEPRLNISNRVMVQILHRLLLAEGRLGGERVIQRVSYRSLDVEQFGYMYEGLLDHVVKRAAEPELALQGAKNRQPELPLRELEARSGDDLIAYLADQTGRSASALINALDADPDSRTLDAVWSACAGDETLYARVLPYANLLFDAEYGTAVILPGRLYVTEGQTRRATGTHYTPVTLTGPIVEHTLEPLVYHGPAEGLPRDQWTLRSPRELLDLKICDMAMGSGAFLVQACRYLSRLLVDAWTRAESDSGGRITPEGDPAHPTDPIVPPDQQERDILARRLIADRCLYGVDKNPLAVEMARLSLWLITLDKHRPFTFLDHALKAGDSLVGVSFDQLAHWSLDTDGTPEIFAYTFQIQIDQMIALRRRIAAHPVNTIADQDEKKRLLIEVERYAYNLRAACDALVLSYFNDLPARDQSALREALLYAHRDGDDVPDQWRGLSLGTLRPLHWELEFPEVFLDGRGGFDAFVGNPPFIGGARIRGVLGGDYLDYLKTRWNHARGLADYSAFFFLNGFFSLRQGGALGLIATNTIAQGDTRELGLDYIHAKRGVTYFAENNRFWPGSASVVVNVVHIFRGDYRGPLTLDGRPVERITSLLDDLPSTGHPQHLATIADKSFIGSYVLGLGFVLTQNEAQALIDHDPKNADVLFPYLNGEDLNSNPDQSPSRWAINFFDWPLERAEQYPDCMTIVREKAYPERQKNREKQYREIWWRFKRPTIELYRAIAPLRRVLVVAAVSRTVAFVFVPKDMVLAHKLIVFAFDDACYFAVLQSSFHYHWAWHYSSTMKTDLNYSPTDIFETFPFPYELDPLEEIGETYHETRRSIMLTRWEGLTATYNRFHDPAESASDIADLRRLHTEMDVTVAAAYGWDDLDLAHGFHETRQGLRFTISEPARREVLTRLLALNHARHAEEVAAGLHDKKKPKGKRSHSGEAEPALRRSGEGDDDAPPDQLDLFDDGSPKQRRLF